MIRDDYKEGIGIQLWFKRINNKRANNFHDRKLASTLKLARWKEICGREAIKISITTGAPSPEIIFMSACVNKSIK